MKPQILVIGYSEEHCSRDVYDLAFQVGREIARQDAILITGGLKGVMEAACRGAKTENGLTIGILPQDDRSFGNAYCDIVIATGIDYARNFITAYSADAVIIVGGGAGTATEAHVAYFKSKPIIALIGSGGTADKIANTFLDERRLTKILGENNPKDAVKKALDILKEISNK